MFNCGIPVAKPNVGELGECLGVKLSGPAEAQLVLAASALLDPVGAVLVTRGRAGALAVRAGEAQTMPHPPGSERAACPP